jgi:uncharacterized protein
MEFKGQYLIAAPAQTVWEALNNPEILRQCISGCEHFEKTDPTHFSAAATLKIGPVKARFKANLALSDLDPPRRCTLKGEGQGGIAGFARGEAEVLLLPEPGGTSLSYVATASIGGKLARIGQRLIDGAAKRIADDFFVRFQTAVAAMPVVEEQAPLPEPVVASTPEPEPKSAPRGGVAPQIWVVGLSAVIVVLLLLFGLVLGR